MPGALDRPLVGVGAVVFDEQGRVLLIKRGKPPNYGSWMIPGGTLEWGETLREAAIREVREETGIDIEIDAFVELIEAMAPGPSGHHFIIADYVARGSGIPRAASDALDAVWAGSEDLAAYELNEVLLAVIALARKKARPKPGIPAA